MLSELIERLLRKRWTLEPSVNNASTAWYTEVICRSHGMACPDSSMHGTNFEEEDSSGSDNNQATECEGDSRASTRCAAAYLPCRGWLHGVAAAIGAVWTLQACHQATPIIEVLDILRIHCACASQGHVECGHLHTQLPSALGSSRSLDNLVSAASPQRHQYDITVTSAQSVQSAGLPHIRLCARYASLVPAGPCLGGHVPLLRT